MHKISGWIALVIGFWAHFCIIDSVLAEPPRGATDPVMVSHGQGNSKQDFDRLQIAGYPEHSSHIIYAKDGTFFPGAKGMVFAFPGTGGLAAGPYGLTVSMSGLANELVKKQKYAVAALQNPIYEDLEKFSSLEAMLQWQLKVMQEIKGQIPAGTPLYYIGRSTGAGLGMELLHRYIRGDAGYEIVGQFESMTFYSIEGHTEADIARWYEAELKTPGADLAVTHAGPKVFGDMKWQTERLVGFKGKVPRLVLATGSRDEFVELSRSVETIQAFGAMHPEINFELAIHHGMHEPARPVPEANISNLECLRMILARAFAKDPLPKQGRNLVYLPNDGKVWEGLRTSRDSDEVARSKEVLGDIRGDISVTAPAGPQNSRQNGANVDPSMRLPGAVPVKFDGGDYSSVLEMADLHELHTRVVYPKKGIWFEGAKGITIIITGTSASVDSEYGIAKSMSPVAKELVNKRGQSVLVVQPPVYYLSHDPEARKPYLDKYATTEANLVWFLDLLAYVKTKVPPGTEINFHGRSFGAALGMEAYHRFHRGDPAYAVIGDINRMLLMGVDGHTAEAVEAWHTGEKEFYFNTAEGRAKADPPVVLLGPSIFKDMNFQTEKLPALPAGKKAPRVVLATGANDEFSAPHTSIRPIKDFGEMHPGADVTLAFHNGGHDPGQGVSRGQGAQKQRLLQPLEALRHILGYMYDQPAEGPGFHVQYFPDQEVVEGYLNARGPDQVALCNAVLGVASGQ